MELYKIQLDLKFKKKSKTFGVLAKKMPEFEHVEHANLSKEKWNITKYTKLGSEGFTR